VEDNGEGFDVEAVMARSTPEALEDAVNKLAEPRGAVVKFERRAS